MTIIYFLHGPNLFGIWDILLKYIIDLQIYQFYFLTLPPHTHIPIFGTLIVLQGLIPAANQYGKTIKQLFTYFFLLLSQDRDKDLHARQQ